MSTQAAGAELWYELPGVERGTVIGTAEVTADGTGPRTYAAVVSGEPVRVPLPASLSYSVYGRLTNGERLSGYAEADGTDRWIPVPLAVPPSPRPATAPPRRGFPDAPWAAGWTWGEGASGFVPTHLLARYDHPEAGTFLSAGLSERTNLVQVSPGGGPASFIVLPGDTPLRVAENRLEPEPGPAVTLLDCLHRADLSAAWAVAALACRVHKTIDPRSQVLLRLAFGYYLLDTDDDRLAQVAAALTYRYPWSADAHLLSAHALSRRPDGHDQEVAKHLETAVACGLPAITRGLQLLNDSLDLVITAAGDADEHPVRRYAVYARTDTVLTTFWGESPDAPRGAPILVERPQHFLPLAEEDDPAGLPGAIAAPVRILIRTSFESPTSERDFLSLQLSLEESLRLASRLSLARTESEVTRLAPRLTEALHRCERPAAALAIRRLYDRSVGLVVSLNERREASKQTVSAIQDACHALREHADAVSQARAVEQAQAAIAAAADYTAMLAADVRDTVTALRNARNDHAATDPPVPTGAAVGVDVTEMSLD
ncbi:hypothetical protein [Kitasatospora sp. NPDC059571]|uniref:hypothetical protein n=1 Tax=Kitasatospora sp. NPDC059571 TaxID=3346871 RepID=UPI0036BA2B89